MKRIADILERILTGINKPGETYQTEHGQTVIIVSENRIAIGSGTKLAEWDISTLRKTSALALRQSRLTNR